MELYDLESARELPEQLRHIWDPSRSFAGVPVGKGIPCYLLSGNLDKLKLFFFFVLQIILNVLLIWGKVNKQRVFKLRVVRTYSSSRDLGQGLWEPGKENPQEGSREPLFLSPNSICHPWTQEFFNYYFFTNSLGCILILLYITEEKKSIVVFCVFIPYDLEEGRSIPYLPESWDH